MDSFDALTVIFLVAIVIIFICFAVKFESCDNKCEKLEMEYWALQDKECWCLDEKEPVLIWDR